MPKNSDEITDLELFNDILDDDIEDTDTETGTAIMLLGVPGVGKTFLIDQAKAQIKENNFIVLNMGSVMFDYAIIEGIVNDRDELRNLPPARQVEIQAEACEYIQEEYLENGINIILDTHASILTPGGYLSSLSVWTASNIDLDNIIILEAPPEVIAERRAGDNSRKRRADLQEIQEHQTNNRIICFSYATFTKTLIKIIDSSKPAEALNDFKSIILLNAAEKRE